ncbi:hypothetical protein SHO565_43470 [Streptomyces sp. HO565]
MDPPGQQSAGEVDEAVADRGSQREKGTHRLQVPGAAVSIRREGPGEPPPRPAGRPALLCRRQNNALAGSKGNYRPVA